MSQNEATSSNHLFFHTDKMMSKCLDALANMQSLSPCEFAAASHMYRGILEFFQEAGVIPSYDSEVFFTFLSERHEMNVAVSALECAMSACSSPDGWGALDGHDDCWIKLTLNGIIMICAIFKCGDEFEVYAKAIRVSDLNPILTGHPEYSYGDAAYRLISEAPMRVCVYIGSAKQRADAISEAKQFQTKLWTRK